MAATTRWATFDDIRNAPYTETGLMYLGENIHDVLIVGGKEQAADWIREHLDQVLPCHEWYLKRFGNGYVQTIATIKIDRDTHEVTSEWWEESGWQGTW